MAENEIITIAIEDLESYLAETTAIKLSLKITGITSGNLNMIKAALSNNPTVYVDLSSTEIPNSVTNMNSCFRDCISLLAAPNIPDSVTKMAYCFYNCTSLVEAPVIPDSVTNMYDCFHNCTSLEDAPYIPNSVTNMDFCFYNCTSLVQPPVIPDSVTNMSACFYNCTSLVEVPNISNSVTNMGDCFQYCTSLVQAPVIPDSVTKMYSCFYNCTSLVEAPNIPDSVTNMGYCFCNCSLLHTIHNWQLRDMSKVKMTNCFSGCTSLQNIFVTEPKVNKYSLCYADVNDTTANCTFVNTDGEQSFSVESNKLVVNGMIDELAIGTSLTKDKALELYRYRVPFSNNSKDFSPDDPHMVLWAKNKDKVKSNVVDAGLTIDTALSSTSENPVQNKVVKTAFDSRAYRYTIKGTGGKTLYARITLSTYTELITSCYSTQIIFKAGIGGTNGETTNCIPLVYDGYGIHGWYATSYTDTTRPYTLYLKLVAWADIEIIASRAITIERGTTDYLAADFSGVAYKTIPKITKQLSNDLLHTVDTALSSTSTNPVQNKVVNTAISNLSSRFQKFASINLRKVDGTTTKKYFLIAKTLGTSSTSNVDVISILGHDYKRRYYNGCIVTRGNVEIYNFGTADIPIELYQQSDGTINVYWYNSDTYNNTAITVQGTYNTTIYNDKYTIEETTPVGTKITMPSRSSFVSLWSGTSSTGDQTITLNSSILNFKYILVAGIFYTATNEQKQTLLIPVSEIQWNTTNAAWMMCGSTGETDRRLRFGFPTTTTLTKYASTGSSGHLPVITNVWGII
jgi:hypothetical protein